MDGVAFSDSELKNQRLRIEDAILTSLSVKFDSLYSLIVSINGTIKVFFSFKTEISDESHALQVYLDSSFLTHAS